MIRLLKSIALFVRSNLNILFEDFVYVTYVIYVTYIIFTEKKLINYAIDRLYNVHKLFI